MSVTACGRHSWDSWRRMSLLAFYTERLEPQRSTCLQRGADPAGLGWSGAHPRLRLCQIKCGLRHWPLRSSPSASTEGDERSRILVLFWRIVEASKFASRWPPSTSHRGFKKGLNNTDLNGLGIIQVAVIYIFVIRARFSTDSWPTFSFYPHPTTPLNPLICVSSHLTKLHSQHTHTRERELAQKL